MGIPSAKEVSKVEETTGVPGAHLGFGLLGMGVAAEEVPDVEETAAVGIGHVHDLSFVPTTKEAVRVQSLTTIDNTVLGLDLRTSVTAPSARTAKGQAPAATTGFVCVLDLVAVGLGRLPGSVVPVLTAQPLEKVPEPTPTLSGRRVMVRFYSGGL